MKSPNTFERTTPAVPFPVANPVPSITQSVWHFLLAVCDTKVLASLVSWGDVEGSHVYLEKRTATLVEAS
ncbi:MAG: hypothetical protein AB8B87_24740 [Granulosicoccus sp.]